MSSAALIPRMRHLLAAVLVLVLMRVLPLAAFADAEHEAGTRAMERVRAQWQSIADSGSLVVLRCEGDSFHATRFGPQAKITVEIRSEPGKAFVGIVHIVSPVESNRQSRRANAVPVQQPSGLSFACFETPEAARNADRIDDFPMPRPGRVTVISPSIFFATYRIDDGALVLTEGNSEMRNRILKAFDPTWQAPASPWRKVFRFPIGG